MLRDDSIQLIFDKDNALILLEIEDSTFHIHSLIKSNLHGPISNFEAVHFINGKAQTNTLISIIDLQMVCLSFANLIHRSDNLHFDFYDRIAYWLEDSYLEIF
jgi:hypothetical protein